MTVSTTRTRTGLRLAACLLALAAALPCWAVKGLRPDGSLDRPAISKAYFEGESWTVINALEAFRKGSWRATRDDSLFLLKYLGATYAADPSTRAKAEDCLGRLVRMAPETDLQDLYLPQSAQALFQQIKAAGGRTAAAPAPADPPAPAAPAPTVPEPVAQAPTPDTAAPERTARDSTLAQALPGVVDTAVPTPPKPPEGAIPPSAALETAAAPPTAAVVPTASTAAPASTESAPAARSGSGRRLWPLALGGAGVAAVTLFLVTLGSDEDGGKSSPRPVQVTLEWPKEGTR